MTLDPADRPASAPSLLRTVLLARCPRCGEGRLFAGWLAVAPACAVCGQDLKRADTGDGPAVFVILIVGAVVVTAALVTEVKLSPPYWVHAVLWVPSVIGLSLVLLRPVKALAVALQWKNKAVEGRMRTSAEEDRP